MKSLAFTLFIFSLLLCATAHSGMTQNFIWAKTAGGTLGETGQAVKTDLQGNVYTLGVFRGTVDFDPGTPVFNLTSAGDYDAFLQKLDSQGNFVWAFRLGDTGIEGTEDICIDNQGNVSITGSFTYTADFEPGPGTVNRTSNGGGDIFIAKYSSAGNLIWVNTFGSTIWDGGQTIETDAAGNIYAGGSFCYTVDFDPGPGTQFRTAIAGANSDIFVVKFNSSGNFVWVVTTGNTLGESMNSSAITPQGQLYFSGRLNGLADFDPGPAIVTLNGINTESQFIWGLDTNAQYLMGLMTGGITKNELVVDNNGAIIIAGELAPVSCDFDPGPGMFILNGTSAQNYVAKYSSAGALIWATQVGTAYTKIQDLDCDPVGNIYVNGFHNLTGDFDPGPNVYNLTVPMESPFVCKLGPGGAFHWARIMPASAFSRPVGICYDPSRYIYSTGFFQSTIDFDGGPGVFNSTAVGDSDIFTHKMQACTSTNANLTVSACDSLRSPSGNYLWTVSGTYQDTIPNIAGCDSFMTINLTMNVPSQASIADTACDSYLAPGGQYTWTSTGIYQDTLVNAAGCDSIITIDLTILSSTYAVISPVTCQPAYLSPSGNYTWTTTGIYSDTIPNQNGCDSIFTVNLTFAVLDTAVIISRDTLISLASANSWQWLDCAQNYLPVAGATQNYFIPPVSGLYAVQIISNGCTDTSECINMILNERELSAEAQFSLMPNPTDGHFYLKPGYGFTPGSSADLSVFNHLGQQIRSEVIVISSVIELSIVSAPGMYLIKLRNLNHSASGILWVE